MEQSYMKEKPILPLILSMSMPMIISMTVNSLYNIIDSLFVSKISETAMTALSLVYPIQNMVNAVSIGFGVGVAAVISIFLGAAKQEQANAAAMHGFWLSILHGILLTFLSISVMPVFLRKFTADEPTIALALQYSNLAFLFSTVISLGLFYEKLFQSVGKMTVSMICMMLGCIANIVLDPILIFGAGPIPALGITGAALATGIGQVLTLLSYLFFYYVRPIPVKVRLKHFCCEPALLGKLYSIGIPAALNLALPSVLISALNAILAAYSQTYVLVLGIYYKLQTFLYLSANGIIQGIRPLIGYNYGAGEQKRVQKIYSSTLLLTLFIMLSGTILCQLIPNQLMGLFTDNPATVLVGAEALRIISIGFLVSSLSVVSSGALEGLGKGVPSLAISLLRYLVLLIPTAYFLSRLWGADGVWHAFWITELISAIASGIIYRHETA